MPLSISNNTAAFSRLRRKLIGWLGISGLIPAGSNAETVPPTAPCSFPFDFSRKGNRTIQSFLIKDSRTYLFTIEFLHNGGNDAIKLRELLDPVYLTVTQETAHSDHPVIVSAEYLRLHGGGTPTERNQRLWQGLRSGLFVQKPTNLAGVIPLRIRISAWDKVVNEPLSRTEQVDTLGWFAGGNGRFQREIVVQDLKPGLYQLEVETVKDSPAFFQRTMRLGITYQPKTAPLPDR